MVPPAAGNSRGALVAVRIGKPQHTTYHFAGVEGAVRLVRIEKAGIGVWHIKGEWGAERVTQIELTSGEVRRCDGHKVPFLARLCQFIEGPLNGGYSPREEASRRAKLLADLSSLDGTRSVGGVETP